MLRRRARGQAGFVITLELVLIFTILGIGLLVGLVAIRNALFVWWSKKQAQTVWVYDSDNPIHVLGPVRDFDEHEAPRLFYVDRDVTWPPIGGTVQNYRAFLGVRDDRFTTRHRIFYENSTNCGVTNLGGLPCTLAGCRPCIVQSGDEDGDNLGVGKVQVTVLDTGGTVSSSGTGELSEAGGIGYLYPLQAGPSYGIGRDIDTPATGLPGTLYRQTAGTCNPALVRSRWTSQTVTAGLPCEPMPAGATVTAAKCPGGAQGGVTTVGEQCGNVPPADSRCVVTYQCNLGSNNNGNCESDADCPGGSCGVLSPARSCGCPGWGDANPSNNWIDYGANCCPPGTTQTAFGQCQIANDGTLRPATPVLSPSGTANALAGLVPPFRVNLPPDTSNFVMVTPNGSEGAAGTVTATPYDPDSTVNYNVAPSGEQSPP